MLCNQHKRDEAGRKPFFMRPIQYTCAQSVPCFAGHARAPAGDPALTTCMQTQALAFSDRKGAHNSHLQAAQVAPSLQHVDYSMKRLEAEAERAQQ